MKRLAQFLLLGLVVVAVGSWAWQHIGPTSPSVDSAVTSPIGSETIPTPIAAQRHDAVVVTYFTSNVRCRSCRAIEELTRRTVEERFAKASADGRVVFQALNIDQPENRHFASDYQLSFKTVVVSQYKDGVERSWQKMDDVWRLFDEPEAFMAYLSEAIEEELTAET